MIQSAFHRTGDPSRREGLPHRCVSLRLVASVSRCCARPRRRCRSSDFCHCDTIVSTTLRKVGSSLLRRAVQAHGPPRGDESPSGPDDFRHPRERRWLPSLRLSFFDAPCETPTSARERAVPVTSPPFLRTAFLVGTGREPRVEDPRRTRRAPTRRSLEHLLVTGAHVGVWRALPRDVPAEDTLDVSRPAKGTNDANASRCFRSSITRSRA
jgi:hypothetical protein